MLYSFFCQISGDPFDDHRNHPRSTNNIYNIICQMASCTPPPHSFFQQKSILPSSEYSLLFLINPNCTQCLTKGVFRVTEKIFLHDINSLSDASCYVEARSKIFQLCEL